MIQGGRPMVFHGFRIVLGSLQGERFSSFCQKHAFATKPFQIGPKSISWITRDCFVFARITNFAFRALQHFKTYPKNDLGDFLNFQGANNILVWLEFKHHFGKTTLTQPPCSPTLMGDRSGDVRQIMMLQEKDAQTLFTDRPPIRGYEWGPQSS